MDIVNAAPVGGAVLIAPDAASEGVTLSCVPSGAEDPDGDHIDWHVVWWVDEVEVESADAQLGDEHFDRGQRVARPGRGSAHRALRPYATP